MSLRDYARKRRFGDTPEPAEDAPANARGKRPIFVVQLHNARARHYDFRLEADGALKSWAVPKGPSLRAGDKRLAVQVEDHPLSYAGFQGEIPEGNYGAGHVLVFDHGVWSSDGDPLEAIAAGKLDFTLHGGKLRGAWKLIRTGGSGTGMRGGRGGGKQWLLIKRNDQYAQDLEANDLVEVEPGPESSAKTGRIRISVTQKESTAASSLATSTIIVSKRAPASAAAARKRTAAKAISTPRKRRNDSAWAKRAMSLDGARARPFAAGFRPELATLRETAPTGDGWLHEVKWDGYRMLADVVGGVVKLRSRNNLDWTRDFPEIVAAINALPVTDARLDGELVALDARGNSDFSGLQRTLQGTSNAALRYVVFDLPGVANIDISNAKLIERKTLLQALLEGTSPELVFSQHVVGHGAEVFAASGKQGLEGIISKRVDALYTSARNAHWVKVKHAQTDEFVVVGYTAPKGARSGFGALLMAAVDDGALRYAGRVGTGYTDTTLREVLKQLQPLQRKMASVALPDHLPHDKRDNGTVHWVEPKLVAEVAYRGWGKEGLLRQASFQRLRIDKRVEDLGMARTATKVASKTSLRKAAATKTTTPKTSVSKAATSKAASKATTSKSVATKATSTAPSKTTATSAETVQISSRERVVYAEAGITKGEVADYYRAVADWILPELANRPLSLVRCPDGADGECFFQKHHAATLGKHVRAVTLKQKSGAEDYLYVRDIEGLLELVQMNALEFHPWGSHVDKPELPDVMVFDLDPGPGVTWKQVVAGGRDVRARLQEAGLESYVRLSGGKGLHVVAPIARGPSWDRVKDFTGAFAEAMAAQKPNAYVATMSKAKRDGKIFIDWLRNGRGATSVASWSLRARPGAPVAMPIRWEELGRVASPAMYNLHKAMRRATTLRQDPWEGYAACKQALPKFD